ncbi:AAA family ATPase [Rhizobium leguminosarum]|uniref:ATP-binding protein n=1 Tax=Rhizobium leguminosarum TaxID=384 RepID=UPI001C93B7EB|nr:ATP-binding protein [Rhizobium leguminosarum]MBY5817059.1 AAA family ATPase [Rhizobium leguminosarum]
MIFVGGASGTGKTTAIERFVARHPDFIHLRASKILSDRKRPLQNLSFADLEENQLVLRNALLASNLRSKVILDGHATIPVTGGYYNVPVSFFDQLPLSALIFLWADPKILLQRKGAPVDARDVKVIEELQRVELQQMRFVANRRDCPFDTVNAMEEHMLEKLLLKHGEAVRFI